MFRVRLNQSSLEVNNILSMGIDPDLSRIPLEGTPYHVITRFYREIFTEMKRVEVFPSLFKPNIAFFEQYGIDGYRALQELLQDLKQIGIPVLLDAKRGDIGKTASAYAKAVFQELGVDAVTLNPYLGWDSIEPYLPYLKQNKGIYILVRTSNPGAADFQDLDVAGKTVYEHVLDKIIENFVPGMGIVAGGTNPVELARILRKIQESACELSVLVPGYGAQGASGESIIAAINDSGISPGLVRVNSSSAISFAWEQGKGGPAAFPRASVAALKNSIEVFSLDQFQPAEV